jgi:uncharacterized protein with ParB-like and HNH nuclease domain
MEARNHSIKEILGSISGKDNFYVIPPYQREYAWGKNEWEQLFNDILENGKNYFLGSIICIENKEEKKPNCVYYDLIDGQQRLTTISILLASIYFLISEYDDKHPELDILNSKKNKKFARLFNDVESLLVYEEKEPKLKLSLQKNNNEDYLYLLSQSGLLSNFVIDEPKNYGNRRISRSDIFFYNLLQDLLEENDISEIFNFLENLLSAIIVKIDVEDVSSAFTLFESINNRGIPLTPIDLIKNSIIKYMEKDYGEKPENTNKQWQVVINNIENYKDQVRFLRHYYNAFKYKYNTDDLPSKATRSNLIKIYQELIKKDVKKIFEELLKTSKIYTAFVHPENIENDKFKPYQEIFENFLHLGVAPSYALLLYVLYEDLLEEKDFLELLELLEKWFIRRNLTNSPGTSKLDSIFMFLINEINNFKNEKNSQEILSFIKKELTKPERFMQDEDFEKFLKTRDLYEENAQALKYLLVKLEMSKRTKENKTDFWETFKGNQPKWTIEHILPQNPSKDSEWYELFGEDIEKYQKMLGNLTLTCYNSNLSNKSFNDKSHYKDKNGNDIGLKSGNVKINDFIKTCEKWTKECIEKRTEIMIKEIKELLKI